MKTIIIIGGGAAGLMAAISASESRRNKVIVLEHNEKPGKKLFITGKGRCNITNACVPDEFLANVVTNRRFMYSAFSRFSNHDMMEYLQGQGLKIKTERGQRVFPQSDRSADVIDTLKRACKKGGVDIRYHSHVQDIVLDEDKTFKEVVLKDGSTVKGDALIIAAGGVSYPQTGSDGSGYELAKSIGHTIKEPYPSLVPFEMEESWCKDLMGLALKNIAIKIKNGKKVIYEGFGEFLFTHFGVSGPLVLTASTVLGKYQKQLEAGQLLLYLDLKPALSVEQLDKRLLREFDVYRNKNISNVMDTLLPKRMVETILTLCDIMPDKKVRDISKKERNRIIEILKGIPLHITGVRGFEEAIITRGGVNTKEVDPKTMASKLAGNVYFAGEILDIDAVTGGFNLQIAWSTGYCAGIHASDALN